MSVDWSEFAANGTVDWAHVEAEFPHVETMRACIQDAVHHGEGDVWKHTKMVTEALLAEPEFQDLEPRRKTVLGLTALWHDIAKPETRTVEIDPESGRERVGHPHHAKRGAVRAWHDLWRAGVPRDIRLDVFSLVMAHQRVFHLMHQSDVQRDLARFSVTGSWYELTLFAKADNRGRICQNQAETEDELNLVRMYAEEQGCLHTAWNFPSDQARVRFGRGAKDSLFFNPQPPQGSKVIVLCGVPGMGKDTYVQKHVPKEFAHISLDLTREELDISPTGNQGKVIQTAMEECRVCLRTGAPFVFNATNLTRDRRSKIIDLALNYDAHVEIHALDVPEKTLRKNNRERKAALPEKVIDRMIEKWEPPTLLEAHGITWVAEGLVPELIGGLPTGPGPISNSGEIHARHG